MPRPAREIADLEFIEDTDFQPSFSRSFYFLEPNRESKKNLSQKNLKKDQVKTEIVEEIPEEIDGN